MVIASILNIRTPEFCLFTEQTNVEIFFYQIKSKKGDNATNETK